MEMTLDNCVYALADLLDETVDVDQSLHMLKDTMTVTEFNVDDVVKQFTEDYKCGPERYVKNIQDDEACLIDSEFDSL